MYNIYRAIHSVVLGKNARLQLIVDPLTVIEETITEDNCKSFLFSDQTSLKITTNIWKVLEDKELKLVVPYYYNNKEFNNPFYVSHNTTFGVYHPFMNRDTLALFKHDTNLAYRHRDASKHIIENLLEGISAYTRDNSNAFVSYIFIPTSRFGTALNSDKLLKYDPENVDIDDRTRELCYAEYRLGDVSVSFSAEKDSDLNVAVECYLEDHSDKLKHSEVDTDTLIKESVQRFFAKLEKPLQGLVGEKMFKVVCVDNVATRNLERNLEILSGKTTFYSIESVKGSQGNIVFNLKEVR